MTSDFTCNEACWSAREDACSCSCGGANHGILRPGHANYVEGADPKRNSKIKGHRYILAGVGRYYETTRTAREIEMRFIATFSDQGKFAWTARMDDERKNGEAAIVRKSSESEAARWPELQPFMAARPAERRWDRPHLVWIRQDLAELAQDQEDQP